MSVSGLPFDDIRELIAGLPDANEDIALIAKERSATLTKAFGLGEVESGTADWLAAWSGKSPSVNRPMIALFAGTHSVFENQPDWQDEGTLQKVTRMAAGGAPVNQVCATNDIGLKVFDLALQYPVADITQTDALDEKAAAATIGFGMEAIAGGVDLLGLAAFGSGAQISNVVLAHQLTGMPVAEFTAPGDGDAAQKLVTLAQQAAARQPADLTDPLELLRRLGGREHSALMGGILAARVNHVPVVLEGDAAIVIAGLLQKLDPGAVDHCRFAASSKITAFRDMQEGLGIETILPSLTASGEGATAGQAMALIKSVAAVHGQSVVDIPDN